MIGGQDHVGRPRTGLPSRIRLPKAWFSGVGKALFATETTMRPTRTCGRMQTEALIEQAVMRAAARKLGRV